jgi:hypothetical protein
MMLNWSCCQLLQVCLCYCTPKSTGSVVQRETPPSVCRALVGLLLVLLLQAAVDARLVPSQDNRTKDAEAKSVASRTTKT